MNSINSEQINILFGLSTVEGVKQFLSHIEANSNKWKWFPLGGRENNSGSVNLAMDPGQALVERITNAMDAHIELQYELAGCPHNLNSPREAVQQLWNLESSRLTRESPAITRFIEEMAPKSLVRVVGSMRREHSSVIIQDSGIGQHPNDLPKTILGLQESNKNNKRYLMGAFGQGGSSTFAYCPYSLIISRRHPHCLDGKTDLIGWTVVRQFDDDSWKTFRYEYLVGSDGLIPRIEPSAIESLGIQFEYGTKVVHFAYELVRLNSRWSLVGLRFFDNLLFDPVLPYRIEDHRLSPPFNRNLHGGRNRLEQVEASKRPDAQTYEADLSRWGADGTAHIRYWVFRPGVTNQKSEDDASAKLDSYLDYDHSPRTILFTLNGQRHHSREKSLVRETRLGALADYLLVHVDCDDLSLRLKKEMFTATRAGATIGERREDLIINAIREALADPWLKQKLDDILRRREALITNESTRRVNQMLNRLITVYRQERSPGGRSGSGQEGGGRDSAERKVKDPPRSLKFADHRRLELINGDHTTIYMITDGPDDLLYRRRRRGNLTLTMEGDDVANLYIDENKVHGGRIPVHVNVSSSTGSGQAGKIVASLEMDPDILLTDMREIKIVPPPPPYVGIDPPTKFEFAKNTTMTVELGRRSITEVHTNARNDLVTRAVQPAHIQAITDIPEVFVSVRGPRDGVIHLEVHAASEAQADAEGILKAMLTLFDGTTCNTTRPIKLIAPKPHAPSPGDQVAPAPAYQLKRVWQRVPGDAPEDISWSEVNYNAERVGHFEPNADELWLYVNMDERQFQSERLRWGRRFGESTSERLVDRYIAYLAFHLFQLYDHSQKAVETIQEDTGDGNGNDRSSVQSEIYDPESPFVSQELRRVAGTLIQTMRSEAELARLQEAASDAEN